MSAAPLCVGSVPYFVAHPVDAGLEEEPGIAFRRDVPARLVEDLRAGTLDVALVSSIELFRRPGYRYLDGPLIAGGGFVASVQVFLARPLEEVRTVALDPASRTSRALLQVLFERRRRAGGPPVPRFLEVDPGADLAAAGADAFLEIGDPALRRYHDPRRDAPPPVFNPSEAWCAESGLPFVFAAWVVAPGAQLEPEHLAAFRRARERGRATLERTLGRMTEELALPEAPCRRYLERECRFELGSDLAPALAAWGAAAAAVGECPAGQAPAAVPLEAEP